MSINGKEVTESRFVANVKNIISPPVRIQSSEPKKKSTLEKSSVPYNPNAIKSVDGLNEGDVVKHRVFGHGRIVSITGETIKIQFQKEKKTLLLETCFEMGLLEPADGAWVK